MFKIGDEVRPANPKSYGGNRRGTVVEVTETRVRVLWDKQPNGVAAKRTWLARKSVILVVRAKGPDAVGPGGWLLDTDN